MAISYVGAGAVVRNVINPTLAVPAGVVERDLLIIITTSSGASTVPTGWTTRFIGGSANISIFYKFADATNPSVTVTNASANSICAVMIAYRGVGATDTISTVNNITATSIATNTLVTSFPNEYVISVYTCDSNTMSWGVPASTSARVNAGGVGSSNGLLVVDELQTTAGTSAARTATSTTSRLLTTVSFAIIPGGENKYWVGGTGTWDTTSTTNWSLTSGGASGAIPPGINDTAIFDQASTYTVTMTGALACFDMTVSAGTVTFATGTTPTLAVSASMSLVAGTIWTNTGALTFTAINSTRTVTTNGVTINSPITFLGSGNTAGAWSLGSALTTGTTVTTTLTYGTLTLNGFDLTTGSFSSNNTNARIIAWGTNSIYLTNTTAAQTVLNMAVLTNYSFTGTPSFISDASSVTGTYAFGTTGGSITNAPNLTFTGSGTAVQTFTTGSWFGNLNFGTTAFNLVTTALNIDGNLTLSSGGTFSGLTVTMVASGTITSNTNATLGALTITTGTTTLGDAFSLSATSTVTLTTGTLNLNGFNLTTGIFSSNNSNTRVITFGSNFIYLVHTTAAQTVLNLGNTNLTWTGTGGFSAAMTVTRTFTAGGTPNNSIGGVNLFITSGASAITLTSGTWFGTLDFTGSTSTASLSTASNINVTNLILAAGGTYTGLGVTTYNTGTVTTNGKSIANFTAGSSAYTLLPTVTTLAGPISCTRFDTSLTGTHTLDFASYNLTSSGLFVYNIGTLSNIATITCTTFTVNQGSFELTQGTITPSVSFTITGGGSFTYTGGTLSAVPTFTQTLGNVTLNQAYALTTTGTYTLTSGTLTLSANLTTGSFITTGTLTRAIQFSTNQITLTGNNATIWDGGSTGITYTGTPTIVSTYAGSVGTRTINVGTGWTEATAFDVKTGSAVGISIGTSGTDTVAIAGNLETLDLTGMLFTYSPGVMTVYGSYTIPATGGSVSASANLTTFASTQVTPVVITVSRSINFPITFSGVGGTFNLGSNFTTGATRTTTLTSGTLELNGYDYSTGLFSSAGALARAISFGSNSITVSGTGTVWDTGTITSLTISGTPVVNVTNASATATSVLPGALPENQSISFNFTAGTYALTFLTTTGYTARDVNFTGFAGTLAATAACTVYGSYTISSGMTVTASANTLAFGATSGTNIITTSGKTMPPIAINGLGGTFNLSDSLTTSGLFQVLAGTFSTTVSNHNITCTQFDSSTNTSARSISLNGSTVTISGTAGITLDNTNLTFNAGTSQITLTNATSTVISAIGGVTFYNVSCTGGGAVSLSTVNTYNNLTLTNGPSVPSVVTVSDTQTINGVFASVSTNASTRLTVQSVTDGVQETISAGSVSLTDADFQDIYAAGATIPWTGTRLGNLGNDINITFGTSNTRYWSLAAGGNWNAVAWATSSGGTPSVDNFPLPQDTCIIENTGLNTSATITINANWNIGSINMSSRTNAMTLAIGVTTPFIFGSWINGSGYTITGTGTVNFVGQDAIQTITGSAITFTPNINIDTVAQTVQLGSALTMGATSTFTLDSGILSLNGYNLTTGIFSSNNTNTRTIQFGSNNIVLSHTTAATTVLSMANATGFNYTGTGGFTSGMSVTRTFTCATTAAVSGSVLFNGSTQYLTTASALIPASTNFTVECWVYPTSFAAIIEVFSQYTAATTGRLDVSVAATTGFPILFIGDTVNLQITGSVALSLNTWSHLAVTRSGNNYVLYLNGVSVATGSATTAILQTGFMIGALNSSPISRYFSGYISNFRVVNGVAVYTGNFTPSTTPLTATQSAGTNISAITGTQTSLLLNTPNNASFLQDYSTNNFTVTNNGTATSNALTPITVLPSAGVPPNLALTSGASIPTFTSGSTFNILDFTGSTCIPAATVVNLNSNLVLASGGTYTALSVSMNGAGTNTITGNSKTIAALTFTAGTNSIADTLTCTIFTINGTDFNFTSGTLNPTTSFVLTSGSFTYNGGTLGAVPTFTHTAGTVTFNSSYALTVTGTYTLTAGTLILPDGVTLTTGIFSSNNTNTRTIEFGDTSAGNINLTHTTAATTVLSMANTTGFVSTGPGGFTVANMANTRTFTCGTVAAVSGSIAFNGSTQYLSRAANAAFNLASGDFTIEAWVYITSYADSNFLFTVATASETGGTDSFGFGTFVTTGALFLSTGATNYFYSTSPVVPLNTWSHIALVRSGTTYTVWLNGSTSDSIVQSLNLSGGGEMRIGRGRGSSTNYFNGSISNLRMVKGVAVYTGSFTPSTSPLTATQSAGTNISAITGTQTSLLLNTPNNASFLQDYSTNNFSLTNNGTATSNASTPITVLPAAGTPPNLTFTTGASVATITTAGSFNTLDFGSTSFTIAATNLNLYSLITSSSSGVLINLTATMRGTGSVVTTNRIGPLIINSTSGTTTMASLVTNLITSLTVTSGNLVIDSNSVLNCTTTATLSGGTLLNYEGLIQCTIFTIAGSTFVLSAGSVQPSVSFVITSGAFTLNYSPAGGLATVPTFTHTAGTVQFNYSYALTATGTYTFTAGTLSINDDITLSTGIFSSTNANTRTINFGLTTNPGYISLTHTTAATVVLSMANITGLTVNAKGKWDGNVSYAPTQVAGGFKSETTVTRTFTCGTTGGNSANAPCLYVTGTGATQLPTFTTGSWFGDFSIYNLSTMTIATTLLNINSLYGAGYYYSLNTTSMSISFRGSGFINYEGNIDNTFGILGAVTINHSGTTSMVYQICAATSVAFTSGTLECRYWVNGPFNGYGSFKLTGVFTQTGGSWYNNAIYIENCTTYTINGATVSFVSGSVTATTSVVLTSGSFTYNGGTLSAIPLFTHTNGTATFNYNYSLAVTGTYTLTAGTLTLANGVTLNTGIFSSTGAGIRSIAFGSTSAGNINLTHTTAATVVLNMAALGGFSYTGTGGFTVADMTNTRTFSVGNTSGGSLTTAPRLTFTTGASIPTLTTASWFNNLDFGTTSFAIGTTSLNLTADLTLSSSGTYTSLTAVMVDTGTATLTTNGKTIAALTINGPAGVFTFAGIVTVTGALTLTSGTVNTSYAINSGSFASTGTATRGIVGTNITYTVSGAGATAFSNASGTGFTMTGLVISMTNAAAKTFAGNGGTYPVLNNGGAGALTISGSNTFDTISNSVQPTTFTFTIGTTQTVNNFNVAGIAGSLVTINSSTAATAATLSKASGTVYGSYLSIRDSTATGGATWYAGPTSTNTSNNTGWIFARLPIVTFGSLTMDTTDGGITISDDPIPV